MSIYMVYKFHMSILPIFTAAVGGTLCAAIGWIAGPVTVHLLAGTKIGQTFASMAKHRNNGQELSEREEHNAGTMAGIATGAVIGAFIGYAIGS